MEQNIQLQIGEQIRKIRTKKGISQEKLAFRSNLHRTYISSVERGERNISIQNLAKIANALDVHLSELIPKYEV